MNISTYLFEVLTKKLHRLLVKNQVTLFLLIAIFFLSSADVFSQGRIPMKNKTFLGALEFLPNSKLSQGYATANSPFFDKTDPLVDPKKWYSEGGNEDVRGMMSDAVLFLEWWTTLEQPRERYKFDWTSSGYFEIYFKDINTIKRINRSDLAKYPNLLKRFDNIAPKEITFEFTFDTHDIPDEDYWAFRKKYGIMEDLGSAGYNLNFTRVLNGNFILFKRSGETQNWTIPGMTIGGWNEFLNFPEKHEDRRTQFIELFKMGKKLEFKSYKINSIKWKVSDLVYIAKKFEAYESGKEQPSVFDEVAEGEQEKKAGDGFWDETEQADADLEPFYDSDTRKWGFKNKNGKVVRQPEYPYILPQKKNDFYFAYRNGNEVVAINKMGNVILSRLNWAIDNYSGRDGSPYMICEKTRDNVLSFCDHVFHEGKGYTLKDNQLVPVADVFFSCTDYAQDDYIGGRDVENCVARRDQTWRNYRAKGFKMVNAYQYDLNQHLKP